MSLLTDYADSSNSGLRQRTTICLFKVANAIAGELKAANVGDAKYAKRQALATYVLRLSPGQFEDFLTNYCRAIMGLGTVTLASDDLALQGAVISLWDDFAGVTALD